MEKFEAPKQPSPEEMAKIEKERALSDAELLKDGAEYKFDVEGNKTLEATDEQIEKVKEEMEEEKGLNEEDLEKKIEKMNDDERNYYDSLMAYHDVRVKTMILANEGKINPDEFNATMDSAHETVDILSKKVDDEQRRGVIRIAVEQQESIDYKMMQDSDSFDDLYKALRRKHTIQYSDGSSFGPNHFIDIIEKVKNGELKIDSVTRAGGLRDKVEQLLEKKDEVKADELLKNMEEKKIEGTISISEEKRQEIHEKVMKEEEKRRGELKNKTDFKKFSFRNRAEENIYKEKENVSKKVESDDHEQEKLDQEAVISEKLMETFLDRVKEIKSELYQSTEGNAEGIEAYESQRGLLAREKIFPDSQFDSFDNTTKEKILVEDMDLSRMMGKQMYKPDLFKLQEYVKEKNDFSKEELPATKAALGDLIDDGFHKLFRYNDSSDIKVALSIMSNLSEKSNEFNPEKFGYYNMLSRIGTGLANIEFDLETKPNFEFARPEYKALKNNLNQLFKILSNIGAKRSLKEEK